MLCVATMRDHHLAAAARWKQQEADRPRSRKGHLRRLRGMRKALQRENAAKEKPDPVCRLCGVVVQKEDMDWLFTRLCGTCGIQKLERLVLRIIRNRGRRRTIRRLRRLAKG
jgi:hypothetical protein